MFQDLLHFQHYFLCVMLGRLDCVAFDSLKVFTTSCSLNLVLDVLGVCAVSDIITRRLGMFTHWTGDFVFDSLCCHECFTISETFPAFRPSPHSPCDGDHSGVVSHDGEGKCPSACRLEDTAQAKSAESYVVWWEMLQSESLFNCCHGETRQTNSFPFILLQVPRSVLKRLLSKVKCVLFL